MKIALAATMFVVACLTLTPARLAQTESSTQQPTFTPFTLVGRGYSYDSTTEPGPTWQETIARRSDGTTATLYFSRRNGQLATVPLFRHLQFLDEREAYVYDPIHAFVKWPTELTVFEMNLRSPPKNCVRPTEIFDKSMVLGGLQVIVVRQMVRYGRVRTEWRAPDLACETVRSHFRSHSRTVPCAS